MGPTLREELVLLGRTLWMQQWTLRGPCTVVWGPCLGPLSSGSSLSLPAQHFSFVIRLSAGPGVDVGGHSIRPSSPVLQQTKIVSERAWQQDTDCSLAPFLSAVFWVRHHIVWCHSSSLVLVCFAAVTSTCFSSMRLQPCIGPWRDVTP